MRRSPRIPRALTALGVGAALAGGLLTAAPASARTDGDGTASSGPTSSVTVLLKAPNQAGLNRLAAVHGLTHAQRVAALSALLPSAASRRAVINTLTSEGLTITHETAWTVEASAPTETVEATFGSLPSLPAHASTFQQAQAASALPRMPAALSPLAAAVLPTSGGPKLFTPKAICGGCRNGNDFRNAYTTPHVAPTTGEDSNGALTIATLQFAGWNDEDLTTYAKSVGLPDPVADGQFTQIPVDGATVPAASTHEDEADEEVDLDQETILSTDPAANQRAYFDTNATKAGYADALSQVLADVTQGTGAVNGGDPKIAALSTSWGTCESEFSDAFAFPHDTITAIENIMKSLTAAGVTVFAASGDDGVYDCDDSAKSTKVAVDYPASSPEVIGVGGSRLKYVGNSAANTGHNWVDTAWSCTSAQICQGASANDTGGSGGGESSLFAMPSYQKSGIGRQPFTTSTDKVGDFGTQAHRLVPDIADDGDPDTGFGVVTTDPSDDKSCSLGVLIPTCRAKTFVIGGTSLSAPEAASLFTDMLGKHDATGGVGDIHAALYSAYAAHSGAFRDIKNGRNGRQQDVDARAKAHSPASELPVTAQKGFDTVTGLGAALWPKIAAYIFAPAAPVAAASFEFRQAHSRAGASRVTATWRAKQAAKGGSAPRSATVSITRFGASKPVFRKQSAAANGTHTFDAVQGGDYLLTVAERDLAGQPAVTVHTSVAVPYDDRTFTFHGTWVRVDKPHDFGGSHAESDSRGAYATASAVGAKYFLGVRTGPSYGVLAVYQGATKIGTYDLYSRRFGHREIAIFGSRSLKSAKRIFSFRYTGMKNAVSSSATIDVDQLYAPSDHDHELAVDG